MSGARFVLLCARAPLCLMHRQRAHAHNNAASPPLMFVFALARKAAHS
jgi:hypothetical protein